MRYLLDVIPLDATLVRGSHGRLSEDPRDAAVFLSSVAFGASSPPPTNGVVDMCSVAERVLGIATSN
jgi:hypothetical protein